MELEELLAKEGVIDRAAALAMKAKASAEGKSLVTALVDEGLVSEDVVADLQAKALRTVVVDLEHGTLDIDAVHLVPQHLARRHLMIVVSTDVSGGGAQVVFADATSREAMQIAREATGLAIQPLVATVSSVRAAIESEYEKGTRRIARPPSLDSDFPSEDTRRVESPRDDSPDLGEWTDASVSIPAVGTRPVHRIEQDATIEQRHEALLLALIEAGVLTRAEYAAALRRLLGHSS